MEPSRRTMSGGYANNPPPGMGPPRGGGTQQWSLSNQMNRGEDWPRGSPRNGQQGNVEQWGLGAVGEGRPPSLSSYSWSMSSERGDMAGLSSSPHVDGSLENLEPMRGVDGSNFSTSFSAIFDKMRLSESENRVVQSLDTASAHLINDLDADDNLAYGSLEELELHTIGNLLPDDDDLLAGVVDDYDASQNRREENANNEELEEFDLFSSGGGMELEGDAQDGVGGYASNHRIGDGSALSVQELVDCDKKYNQGCNGGLMDYAFDFVIQNGGIDTEKDYPYQGYDGRCDVNKMNARVVTIDSYEDVPENDEEALKKAVAGQPVSVAIEAGGRDFQLYSGGVFTGRCGTDLDHGVLAVGYGSEKGLDYWIVKNSWGEYWGESGYLRMQRNLKDDNGYGLCGINIEPSYAVKTSPNPPNPGPTPPSPPPPEVICDKWRTCPAENTCCCTFPVGKSCLAWGCCALDSATCCDDHYHCCPHEYPICNLDAGLCLKGSHDKEGVALMKRTLAHFNWAGAFE